MNIYSAVSDGSEQNASQLYVISFCVTLVIIVVHIQLVNSSVGQATVYHLNVYYILPFT